MKSFENAFEPSSCAAAFDGPMTGIFLLRKKSTNPVTKKASGPIIVRSTLFAFMASSTSSLVIFFVVLNLFIFGSKSIPAFPGSTNVAWTEEDSDSRHARACSLPPDPIIKILKCFSLYYSSILT